MERTRQHKRPNSSRQRYYSSSEDDREIGHIATLVEVHSRKSKWQNIGPFLKPFYVPGSRKPFICNGPQELLLSTDRRPNTGHFTKYGKVNETEIDIFEDMLGFLFNGEKKMISSAKDFIASIEQQEKCVEFFELLNVIDSCPCPQTFESTDCDKWSEQLCSELSKKSSSYRFSVKSMVSALKDIWKNKKHKGPHLQNKDHSKWRIVLDTLVHTLIKIVPQMECRVYGHCEDRIPFRRIFDYDRSRQATTTLSVIVQPDLLLLSNVEKEDESLTLRSVTIKIGCQNVALDEAFSSDTSQSSSDVESDGAKLDQNILNAESSTGARAMSTTFSESGCKRKAAHKVNSTTSSESDCMSKAAHEFLSEAEEYLSRIELTVRNQHLLQLIASTMLNKRVIGRADLSYNNTKSLIHTAGILWFSNAVFLTKLSARLDLLDYDDHPGQQTGKYLMCDRVLDPWQGHWKNIAKYLLVCGMMSYTLHEPLTLGTF